VSKVTIDNTLLWSILSALKQSNASNAMSRVEFNKRMGCKYSKSQIDAGIKFLDSKGIVSGDDFRVFLLSGINCSGCSSFIMGDGWHCPSTCNGKILSMVRSDAKMCGGWRPKSLSKELSEGWTQEVDVNG